LFVDLILKLLATIAKPRDCSYILNLGDRSDGVYTAYIGRAQRRVQVYCDQTTDGGGWTVCIIAFKYVICYAVSRNYKTGAVSHQH